MTGSAETAGNIILGEFVLRHGEYLLGIAHLDQLAHMEIGSTLGYPRRLLHGMGYYWDGRDNYVIYSDEDGYTTMKKEKEDGQA